MSDDVISREAVIALLSKQGATTTILDMIRALPAARVGGGEEEFNRALDDLSASSNDDYPVMRQRVIDLYRADLYRAAAPVALKSEEEMQSRICAALVSEAAEQGLETTADLTLYTVGIVAARAVIALHKGE